MLVILQACTLHNPHKLLACIHPVSISLSILFSISFAQTLNPLLVISRAPIVIIKWSTSPSPFGSSLVALHRATSFSSVFFGFRVLPYCMGHVCTAF